MGSTGMNWGVTGLYWDELGRSMGVTGMNWEGLGGQWEGLGGNWFILGGTGINWDELGGSMGSTGRDWGVTGLYWEGLGSTGMNWGGQWDELGGTGGELVYTGRPHPHSYWSILVYTGPYWSILVHTGPQVPLRRPDLGRREEIVGTGRIRAVTGLNWGDPGVREGPRRPGPINRLVPGFSLVYECVNYFPQSLINPPTPNSPPNDR
uniref:Uncharacterized protein n=1 Tax=Columba livia TaxID=8932 RepID=R7VS36_COLLI